MQEFNAFGLVSGSKINEHRTEILKIGNVNLIDHPDMRKQVNEKVMVLGIWLGIHTYMHIVFFLFGLIEKR